MKYKNKQNPHSPKVQNKTLVSIITVVLNGEKNIEETMQSVFSQSYDNIEYIIIDGGSRDGTVDILKRHNNHIDTWITEPDKGVYDAMNKGISLSNGEIVYFLNCGDYLYRSDVIESIVGVFQQNNDADIIYGKVIFYNPADGSELIVGRNVSLADLKKGKGICHQGLFMKSSVFQQLGNFNIEYSIASDFDLICRCFLHGCAAVYTDECISFYRLEGISSCPEKVASEVRKIILNYFGKYYYHRFCFFQRLKVFRKITRAALIQVGLLRRLKKIKYYRLLMQRLDF